MIPRVGLLTVIQKEHWFEGTADAPLPIQLFLRSLEKQWRMALIFGSFTLGDSLSLSLLNPLPLSLSVSDEQIK